MEEEINKAFKVLENYGITRDRAGTISNGISVLMAKKEQEFLIREANKTDDPINYISSIRKERESGKIELKYI